MIFIETPTFTRLITSLLSDDEYLRLQEELVKRPDTGDLIRQDEMADILSRPFN